MYDKFRKELPGGTSEDNFELKRRRPERSQNRTYLRKKTVSFEPKSIVNLELADFPQKLSDLFALTFY